MSLKPIALPKLLAECGEIAELAKGNALLVLFVLSVAHHLRDAKRWQLVKRHEIPPGLSPEQLDHWADLLDKTESAQPTFARPDEGAPPGGEMIHGQ